MAVFRKAVVKGENIELLLLVKEEDRVCVNLTNLDLHFTESPSLYESGEAGQPRYSQSLEGACKAAGITLRKSSWFLWG